MKRIALFVAVLLLVATFLLPQEYKGKGRLVGSVTDEQGVPIEGVRVKYFSVKAQGGSENVSDKDGKWVAAWIRGGSWNIDFEKFGFEPKKISVEVQEFQRNPEVKVVMKKAAGLILTEDLKSLLTKGNALFDEKKYDEARGVFEEILVKYPDAYIMHRNVGNCWFAQEKYDMAEQSYLKVLEKDPKNADAMILIGNTYANRGDTPKALEWYGKLEFDKIDDPIVLYNVGANYYNSGKFEDALKYYRKATEIQKDFPDGLYQLGLTLLNLQNNAEAVAAFEAYLKIDVDSERAGQVRSFLDYLKKK
jgi:tetratricopeptide (TPR) repeat protein